MRRQQADGPNLNPILNISLTATVRRNGGQTLTFAGSIVI